MGKRVARLFELFQPEHYHLHLVPNRDAMAFSGTITIHGKKVGRPSERLTFHQKDLKISSAQVIKHDKKGDQEIAVTRINNQNTLDEVRIHTSDKLYAGEYSITLEFAGQITKPMHGIYPCFFKHNGKEKMLIATQFESHHAREAFPCIDEPEAKATFELALTTPAGETVLSNTPVRSQMNEGKSMLTMFERTPRMSTYLLAFVYGEMHSVEATSKNGTAVRSWATVAQPKEHLTYATDEAVKCLEFLEDYFDTPFPLPKVDQVALPDFESLAMENWGLITFREVGLLADPVNRSLSGEQLITMVVAHELSHQWFGNLVTMRWWDDLWLNESFASIMETLVPDRLHPDWHEWEDFLTGRVMGASHRDIYKDVQSVGVELNHPDEISSLFDPAIVYAKGARLLKMLYDYIGEDAFRAGLKSYFKQHAYGNTTRDDLWRAFSKASGRDIEKLMTPWLQQSGQPLVTVKQLDDHTLELNQERFLLDGQDTERLWPVPLLATSELNPDLLTSRRSKVTFSGETPLLNANGDGHFIVQYTDARFVDRLKSQIIDRTLDTPGRISILNDMLLLARHGDRQLTEVIEVASHCDKEPRNTVWSMFSRALAFAQTLTDGDRATEQHIRAYKRELAGHWYKKLGWQDAANDDPNTKHLRSTAVALSIAGEDKEALETSLKMFEAAGSVEKLPAEQRAMIAGVAVRFGKPGAIKQLMDEYVSSHNPDVQDSIALALSSTREVEVAEKVLDWGLSANGIVRQQDYGYWFAYLMRNHYTRDLAWNWFTDEWPRLVKLFGGGKFMEYFIWYSSGPLSTETWKQKFTEFYEPKMAEISLRRNIQIAFSEIDARIAWRKREEEPLQTFFRKYSQ